MAERLTGTIEAISKDGKRFLLTETGKWYSCFTSSQMKGERGDSVEFNFDSVTKGENTYQNVKGNVRVVGTSARPVEGATAGDTGGGSARMPMGLLPVQLARERAIIRQNALSAAVNFCNRSSASCTAMSVLDIARVFESYTSGDMDITKAMEPDKDVETGADDEGDYVRVE